MEQVSILPFYLKGKEEEAFSYDMYGSTPPLFTVIEPTLGNAFKEDDKCSNSVEANNLSELLDRNSNMDNKNVPIYHKMLPLVHAVPIYHKTMPCKKLPLFEKIVSVKINHANSTMPLCNKLPIFRKITSVKNNNTNAAENAPKKRRRPSKSIRRRTRLMYEALEAKQVQSPTISSTCKAYENSNGNNNINLEKVDHIKLRNGKIVKKKHRRKPSKNKAFILKRIGLNNYFRNNKIKV